MTICTASGLTADTRYTIKLMQPSAVDSLDADYLIATTTTVSDASGNLSVPLAPTVSNQYYTGTFDNNLWSFQVPDSGSSVAIIDHLIAPAKSVVTFASVTSVNGKTGDVSLALSDLNGSYVVSINGSTGAVTITAASLGAVADTRMVAGHALSADVEIALADLSNLDLTAVADGDILIYDAATSTWKNGSASGGGGLVLQDSVTVAPSPQQNFSIATTAKAEYLALLTNTNDASFLDFTFTPQSDKVRIRVEGYVEVTDAVYYAGLYLSDNTGGSPLSGTTVPPFRFLLSERGTVRTIAAPFAVEFIANNLTPGTPLTYYLGGFFFPTTAVTGSTMNIIVPDGSVSANGIPEFAGNAISPFVITVVDL
jgi:hypothetical protein